jgi:hypothetical protein
MNPLKITHCFFAALFIVAAPLIAFSVVCGVDHRVYVLFCDVSSQYPHSARQKTFQDF